MVNKNKTKIRSKRASLFLESETLKILLAVICLGLLVFLGVKLYTLFLKPTALEQARETLDQLSTKIENMKAGEESSFLAIAPEGWYIVTYDPATLTGSQGMPFSCANKNCICLCPYKGDLEKMFQTTSYPGRGIPDFFYHNDMTLNECQNEGICKNLNVRTNIRSDFFYHKPDMVGMESVGFVNWISLHKIPRDVFIKKNSEEAVLTSSNPNQEMISELLLRKVTYNSQETTFGELLLTTFFNNCNYLDAESQKKPYDKALNELVTSEINSYSSELNQKYPDLKLRFSLLYVNPDEKIDKSYSLFLPFYYSSGTYTVKENKLFCNGDFSAWLRLETAKG